MPFLTTTFQLVLLGYRNDLARERTLSFLRNLPPDWGPAIDLYRDTPLPHVLLTDTDHELGLRLATELRERGAQVQLRGREEQTPDAPPPTQTARTRPFSTLLTLIACGCLALGWLAATGYLKPRGPALPPIAQPQLAAPGIPMQQHHLNDEAVQLNASGQFEEAAIRLRAAIENAPDEDVIYANLVVVLRNWAVAEINAGRLQTAIELIEEALDIDEDPSLLALLGVAQQRLGDWHDAEESLQRAVELGTSDPMAFVALGRVYRQQGDQQGAVEMYQRARESGASGPEFATMLERLERELDAEWDFVDLSTPHFRLSFANGEDQVAAQVVSAVLEESYFTVGRKLDLFPESATEVVLYASEDFHEVTQTPDWTGGVYDGRIKLPVRGIQHGSALLQRTVRHEYGHVLVTRIGNGRIPVWLNEGIAIWAEEEEDGDREAWAESTIAGRRLFNLSELIPPFTRLPADRVQVAYAQSYLTVRAILDEYGDRRLLDVLRSTGLGDPLATAFESVLSTRLADFEGALITELTRVD